MKFQYSCLAGAVACALFSGCSSKPEPFSVAAAKKAHEDYLKANASGFEWFANASDSYGGVPLILLKSMPDLAPDIWGKPEDQFASFGFIPNDGKPGSPLPLGLSWESMDSAHPPAQLHPVALTCGACHVGRVRLENGSYQSLAGAPNTQIDVRKWRKAFEATVHKMMGTPKDIAATAEMLRKAIASKPANYYYKNYAGVTDQVEAGERAAYTSTAGGKDVAAGILTAFAGKILLGELATNKQKATSYSAPNAPPLDGGSPGQSDGSGDLIPRLLLFDTVVKMGPAQTTQTFAATSFPALPEKLATVTDILSTFMQADQNLAQVDGSVKSPVFRNVAASLAVAGDPTLVNIQNTDITATFIAHLPPPAYPFAIDGRKVARGKELFQANCAGCHKLKNDTVYSVESIGTDPNRSKVLNTDALTLFVKYFVASVPADYVVTESDGSKVKLHDLPADSVIIPRTTPQTQGYVADSLVGLWTRSPYIHNGAVPTVYHLLAPSERPAKFVRGSVSYDTEKIGYQWQIEKLDDLKKADVTAVAYDTSWDSASRLGHSKNLIIDAAGKIVRGGWDGALQPGEAKVRLDWSGPENKKGLDDLLEYLKTL